MSLFQNVLKTITARLDEKGANKKLIAEICSEVVGIQISPDALTIRDGQLYIKTSPTQKLAITLHAPHIIAALHARGIAITTIV